MAWLGLLIAIAAVTAAWWLVARRGALTPLARRAVERRLGGYRQQAVVPDEGLAWRVQGEPPCVAVIGAGLAGIGAASALAERGIPVTVLECNPYLGGKIGAWKVPVGDGEHTIEHGFHAFFRQYYNLNRFLDRLGLRDGFRAIEDYLIIDAEGRRLSFGDVETTPLLNIVDLGRRGFYRWRDVMPKRARKRLYEFVRFDMKRTYETLDDVTFERYCDEAGLPPGLRVSFRTFARAFFSDEADLSTADVLRAFHFYYLSHDHGLMYDYPAGDYEATLLAPIETHLREHGVELRLGARVDRIERGSDRRFRVNGEEYDWIVLAADLPGAKRIVAASRWMQEASPAFVESMEALRTSNGYAVWRLWVDRDVRPGLPTFINVERQRVLDSVTLYHRITDEARAWAAAHGGAVLELHSYALPPDIADMADPGGEEEIRRVFLAELEHYFPELAGLRIHAESLQVRRDFPAFAPGQRAHRPSPQSPIDGLLMAGDWIALPYPMTHMEAAFTSGLLCANVIFGSESIRRAPIFTVGTQKTRREVGMSQRKRRP